MYDIEKELKFHVRIDRYRPARPAPACQDHDSPRFSDPGNDEECEFTLFLQNEKGELVELEDSIVYEQMTDTVFEYARELYN